MSENENNHAIIKLPFIKKIVPATIAADLVSVQPMVMPPPDSYPDDEEIIVLLSNVEEIDAWAKEFNIECFRSRFTIYVNYGKPSYTFYKVKNDEHRAWFKLTWGA